MEQQKKGILAISFGTSYQETRERTIGQIEKRLQQEFPERTVRRAFTSQVIIRKLKARDGIEIDSIEQALEKMIADGITSLLIQSTHVIQGYETEDMLKLISGYQDRFQEVFYGRPLLSEGRDYEELAGILIDSVENCHQKGTAWVWLGHGTSHEANASYIRLEQEFVKAGFPNFLIGTVEGSPDFSQVMEKVRKLGAEHIVLLPLLIVAGEHVAHDMVGGEDSWKSRFEADGYQVECVIKGLGEYSAIQQKLVDHAREAVNRKGILYGIGVGPGDPELMTLKAVKKIREADVVAIPGERREQCTAYQIALKAVPELEEKECLPIFLPMTKRKEILEECYEKAVASIGTILEQGRTVAFLTLGDPSVYSTYLPIQGRIKAQGYKTEMISAVPSFCAAAAAFGCGLVMREEPLHIIPGSYPMEDSLELPGTKVLMKAGKQMPEVKKKLKKAGLSAVMVENCGMEGERLYPSLEKIPDQSSYYSLIIIKEI